jgi:hypothetical protein
MFIDSDVMYAFFASGRLLLVQDQKKVEGLTHNCILSAQKSASNAAEAAMVIGVASSETRVFPGFGITNSFCDSKDNYSNR